MTQRSGRSFVVACVGLGLAGCQVKTSPSLSPPAPFQEQPIEPAPSEQPQVITSSLPENWHVLDPDFETEELPGGETVQFARVVYQWPVGGQIDAENEVQVRIVGCQSAEARVAYFEMMLNGAGDVEWSLASLGSAQVVRFQSDDTDGRMLVTGPYLIVNVDRRRRGLQHAARTAVASDRRGWDRGLFLSGLVVRRDYHLVRRQTGVISVNCVCPSDRDKSCSEDIRAYQSLMIFTAALSRSSPFL
jgi:hypothetical protein